MSKTVRLSLMLIIIALSNSGCNDQASVPSLPDVSSAGRIFVMDGSGSLKLVVSAPAKSEQKSGYVTVEGVPQDVPPSGSAGPIHFRIDSEFERSASGNRIVVTVLARSSTARKISVAYSTSDVGNSGWQTFDLAPEWRAYVFEYDVPSMRAGNGDYVGFKVDKEVDIRAATVDLAKKR